MKDYKTFLVMSLAQTGVHNVADIKDWQHIVLSMTNSKGSSTVKFVGSVAEEQPDFEEEPSISNVYDYVAVIDLQPSSSALIAGDTGIGLGGGEGTDFRLLKVQYPGLRWLTAKLTSWTSGSVHVKLFATNNE